MLFLFPFFLYTVIVRFCVAVSWFLARVYLVQLHPGNLLVPLLS